MANTGFRGVDVRQTANQLVFRALLQDSTGAKLTTGTTTLKLYELQSDATIKSYDFNDNTFKTTALTTETLAMTHRQGNNSTTNTGLWTAALATLTGFTAGGMYFANVNNTGASPPDQFREWQFGSGQGDFTVDSNGRVDLSKVSGTTQTAGDIVALITTLTGFVDTEVATLVTNIALLLARTPAMTVVSGTVVADAANTATTFKTSLTAANDNYYRKGLLVFSGGTLDQQFRKVITSTSATSFVAMDEAFTAIPANGAAFYWINK